MVNPALLLLLPLAIHLVYGLIFKKKKKIFFSNLYLNRFFLSFSNILNPFFIAVNVTLSSFSSKEGKEITQQICPPYHLEYHKKPDG